MRHLGSGRSRCPRRADCWLTFITPLGRYAFNRLPFGISSAPEHFQRRISQMLEGCKGVVCHADDILVYGEDIHSHDERLHCVLKRLQEEGLTLNDECVFACSKHYVCGSSHHSRRSCNRPWCWSCTVSVFTQKLHNVNSLEKNTRTP